MQFEMTEHFQDILNHFFKVNNEYKKLVRSGEKDEHLLELRKSLAEGAADLIYGELFHQDHREWMKNHPC
jgi:hypothetical protein